MSGSVLERLREAAARWSDPDEPVREAAEAAFLGATTFSEAQVAFALNEQMTALAALDAVAEVEPGDLAYRLEIADGQPLAGLAEAVALVANGARVRVPDEPVSALVAAFLLDAAPDCLAGSESLPRIVRAEEVDEASGRALVLPWRFGAAVLDGKENEEAREHLAEDVLLYDGATPRCVRVVWAPRGLSPDPYLDAFAAFRGRFPASAALAGRVRMMTAFAEKAGLPAAYLDDHSLLITRGGPEVQTPGHLRWVEYNTLQDVMQWRTESRRVGFAGARNGFQGLPAADVLGSAHRPGTARFTAAAEEIAQAQADYAG